MGCNCGNKAGKVNYVAKTRDGASQTFATNAEARIWLAKNGGGSVKAEPKA